MKALRLSDELRLGQGTIPIRIEFLEVTSGAGNGASKTCFLLMLFLGRWVVGWAEVCYESPFNAVKSRAAAARVTLLP